MGLWNKSSMEVSKESIFILEIWNMARNYCDRLEGSYMSLLCGRSRVGAMGGAPLNFGWKKGKIAEGRKADMADKPPPPPFRITSRSGSTTTATGVHQSYLHHKVPVWLRYLWDQPHILVVVVRWFLYINILFLCFLTGNETEISFFKKEDYERYKANPAMKW